jgi:hypothetical protein
MFPNGAEDQRFLRNEAAAIDLRSVVAMTFPSGRMPQYGVTLFLQGGGSLYHVVGTDRWTNDYDAAAERGFAELEQLIARWQAVRA